jgi:hypothetical protein
MVASAKNAIEVLKKGIKGPGYDVSCTGKGNQGRGCG